MLWAALPLRALSQAPEGCGKALLTGSLLNSDVVVRHAACVLSVLELFTCGRASGTTGVTRTQRLPFRPAGTHAASSPTSAEDTRVLCMPPSRRRCYWGGGAFPMNGDVWGSSAVAKRGQVGGK